MPHNYGLKLAVLTARMSALWGQLKRDGTAARQVGFLSITAYPACSLAGGIRSARVVYTERGTNIRIISCRKATPTERRHYEEGID